MPAGAPHPPADAPARSRPASPQQRDDHDHREAHRLGHGEAAEKTVVLGAQELDREALEREQTEHGERGGAGALRARENPQRDDPDGKGEGGLVELRGVHRHQLIARHRGREVDAELFAQIGDVGARQPDRELDAPRQIGRPAVVVTHQEAADATEGVAERQRGSDSVGGEPRREPAAAHGPEDGQGGEHETAIPDQPIALEQEPPVLVQDRVVDLGAEDAAQRARQQDRAGVLVVADLEPHQVAAQLQVGREERDHHHHSERADGQRPDTEDLAKHLVGWRGVRG